MNDPWMDRLSEYLDNELPPHERAALDEHLAVCDVCRATLRALEAVVAAAAAVPDTDPATDLWPGIAARIRQSQAETTTPSEAAADVPVTSVARREIAPARRFSFTSAQLAAAAVVLMMLSGGSVWLLQRTAPLGMDAAGAGTIVHSAGAPASTRLVDSQADVDAAVAFEDDVAELQRALDLHRGSLDPTTIEVVERSLESIDDAIADARSALAADPGNENLHRQLDSTMRKKVELLRRVTRGVS
jgi:anti-sigma factor RsiW